MTGKAIEGNYEIVDSINESSLRGGNRLLAPGMEDILSGYTLGQYRLMERPGRGGMATAGLQSLPATAVAW